MHNYSQLYLIVFDYNHRKKQTSGYKLAVGKTSAASLSYSLFISHVCFSYMNLFFNTGDRLFTKRLPVYIAYSRHRVLASLIHSFSQGQYLGTATLLLVLENLVHYYEVYFLECNLIESN